MRIKVTYSNGRYHTSIKDVSAPKNPDLDVSYKVKPSLGIQSGPYPIPTVLMSLITSFASLYHETRILLEADRKEYEIYHKYFPNCSEEPRPNNKMFAQIIKPILNDLGLVYTELTIEDGNRMKANHIGRCMISGKCIKEGDNIIFLRRKKYRPSEPRNVIVLENEWEKHQV